MNRYDLITIIQEQTVRATVLNTMEGSLKAALWTKVLKHVLDGDDKLQLLEWLNKERLKGGEAKQKAIDEIWKTLEGKLC